MSSVAVPSLEWFANTGSGVWAVDANQRIVFWNQAAQELLGFTPAQALGQPCHLLLGGRDTQRELSCQANCPCAQSARQQAPTLGFEMLVRRQNGKSCRIDVSIVVIPGSSEDNPSATVVHIFRPIEESPTPPPSLRIQLLGSANIWRPEGSLVNGPSWRKRKVRILLAFLAIQHGRPAHRKVLTEALWPDREYAAALHNLNMTVCHLRKSLEPTLERGADSSHICYENDCYYLHDGLSLWVDVQAFETGIAQARREPNSDQALDLYRRALILYQGDFLADLGAATAWCSTERERLRSLYLDALEEAGRLHEQRQEYRQANEMYWKALSADSCCESACQRLMRLAALRGDHTAIIALYNSLVAALDREVGARPTQETVSIYKAARRGV